MDMPFSNIKKSMYFRFFW